MKRAFPLEYDTGSAQACALDHATKSQEHERSIKRRCQSGGEHADEELGRGHTTGSEPSSSSCPPFQQQQQLDAGASQDVQTSDDFDCSWPWWQLGYTSPSTEQLAATFNTVSVPLVQPKIFNEWVQDTARQAISASLDPNERRAAFREHLARRQLHHTATFDAKLQSIARKLLLGKLHVRTELERSHGHTDGEDEPSDISARIEAFCYQQSADRLLDLIDAWTSPPLQPRGSRRLESNLPSPPLASSPITQFFGFSSDSPRAVSTATSPSHQSLAAAGKQSQISVEDMVNANDTLNANATSTTNDTATANDTANATTSTVNAHETCHDSADSTSANTNHPAQRVEQKHKKEITRPST